MADKLSVSILTPEGEKFKGEASEILAPAHAGEVGILPGHSDFLSRNVPGVVVIFDGGGKTVFSVGRGFFEVADDQVRLLVDTAEQAEQIDLPRARAKLDKVTAAIAEAGSDFNMETPEYIDLYWAQKRAEARIDAAGR